MSFSKQDQDEFVSRFGSLKVGLNIGLRFANWFLGGRHLKFTRNYGIVASHNREIRTKISSTGGGGSFHNGSGSISVPKITSSDTSHDTYWLTQEDGSEKEVKATNLDLSIREGHQVSFYIADGQYVGYFNHSSKKGLNFPEALVNFIFRGQIKIFAVFPAMYFIYFGIEVVNDGRNIGNYAGIFILLISYLMGWLVTYILFHPLIWSAKKTINNHCKRVQEWEAC